MGMHGTLAAVLALTIQGGALAQKHPGAEAFVQRAAEEQGLDAGEVAALLDDAEYKQSIADAIARPAEAKPWFDYRPIFLTRKRIDEGIEFWRDNRELISRVADEFGVDERVIVAIIGVETSYGRITGSYRVIDALATLAFHYPSDRTRDRSPFFTDQLMHFMVLGKEEGLPLREVTGSYAGAMGMGQFMPSSYREYAVDLDRDGSRDLWRSTEDAVGSVANYLHRHGWQPGGPVTRRAVAHPDADFSLLESRNYKPRFTVMELHDKGYRSSPDLDPQLPAALLSLEEQDRKTYWLVFNNFYVITRYNRSPLYAMAVHQLSEEIESGLEAP